MNKSDLVYEIKNRAWYIVGLFFMLVGGIIMFSSVTWSVSFYQGVVFFCIGMVVDSSDRATFYIKRVKNPKSNFATNSYY